MKKVPQLPVCTMDRLIVSIERVYTPSTFYMKSFVSNYLISLSTEISNYPISLNTEISNYPISLSTEISNFSI